MRALFRLLALLLNGALGVTFVLVTLDGDETIMRRTVCGLIAMLFVSVAAFLAWVLLARLPVWGPRAMRYLCTSLPVAWLLGSFDHGILSGLEMMSVLLISLLAWGSWLAFFKKSSSFEVPVS